MVGFPLHNNLDDAHDQVRTENNSKWQLSPSPSCLTPQTPGVSLLMAQGPGRTQLKLSAKRLTPSDIPAEVTRVSAPSSPHPAAR